MLLLAETLKKLLALGPKTLPPEDCFARLGRLAGLAGDGGVKFGSLDHLPEAERMSRAVIWTPTEVGCGLMRLWVIDGGKRSKLEAGQDP